MTSQYVMSEHETLEFGRLISQHFQDDKKNEKLIVKHERIDVTKRYFAYWFASFSRLEYQKMVM